MRDFPLAAGGTHPEDAGAARGKDPLPQRRKTKRKKAPRRPALRGAPCSQWASATALRSRSCCRPRGTRGARPACDCKLRISINAFQ
ncbi:uncharacterized LOC128071544 homolog [Myotis daubentonii]|uniref:uncharacterized LOC128071544 homolog n=1 Tax=Myotis daubentonii TaxID=98922 RepID=UPI0028738631|nr:uncharacterized LOC128071544 homolog [Myotis daubentonii]XP_059530514.1 uncharacterized LOC128071544 homolog [Myotis daubentonii]XP_059530515.1 uncharacterized LOC128071544 homolog [Myotis daubentonii]XP_059530516.1 uncharacterized LOC128071544 homolog [Myotis daubentonii]XP_059530517.1 uncharacterized LOC128071544 homolog [Myotis daubentonii]